MKKIKLTWIDALLWAIPMCLSIGYYLIFQIMNNQLQWNELLRQLEQFQKKYPNTVITIEILVSIVKEMAVQESEAILNYQVWQVNKPYDRLRVNSMAYFYSAIAQGLEQDEIL